MKCRFFLASLSKTKALFRPLDSGAASLLQWASPCPTQAPATALLSSTQCGLLLMNHTLTSHVLAACRRKGSEAGLPLKEGPKCCRGIPWRWAVLGVVG